MKPNHVKDIMDLSERARERGFRFNPLFVGPPGVGKSEIVQQWCKEKGYEFIDFRAAYREAVDLTGYPQPKEEVDENGLTRQVTRYFTPEFLPTKGKGVFFMDEVNRGTTSVMNTFMQLLTDRKIDKYELPEGWIIAGAINPENEMNDVNSMDCALRDRFEIFEVSYDKKAILSYMEKSEYDSRIIMFIESNTWQYSKPEDVGTISGAKYISPRTFSKLNAALKSEVPESLQLMVFESILGKNVGQSFYQFITDEQPVLYSDLVKSKKKAIVKLKSFSSDPKNYKTGHIAITIKDIVESGNKIEDDLLVDVCMAIPADSVHTLLAELEFKNKSKDLAIKLCKTYPDLRSHLKDVLNKKD